jgi:crotonobetaine/carnitine-CoA ligase
VTTQTWIGGEQRTIPQLLEERLESDPNGEYLDICGTKFSAAQVNESACRIANGLSQLGAQPGDRVATLIENSPEAMLSWWGTIRGGFIAVPVNTAYKGQYLRHQLNDAGATVLVIQRSLSDRLASVVGELDHLRQVVVVEDTDLSDSAERTLDSASLRTSSWADLLQAESRIPDVKIRPSDIGTFVYTGGTTGASKGCMLSHNYHEAASRQIGICWGRRPEDVLWTPLPLYHYNALVTAVLGALVFGGRSAVYRKFSVSNFWPEMNRTGATITSTLGSMAYLLAHDIDRTEMPRSGTSHANATLRMLGAAPMPVEVSTVIKERFGVDTFSGAFGLTEASLISWSPPGVPSRPNAAGVINTDYFDVRIFDDDDNELPTGTDGEIVIRPKRPHVMFEGYWGRPEATVSTSRNWWYHTGDIGRIDEDAYLFFVDRKADYLRRRGENISSFEVESIFMSHGNLADVAVHAVPSQLTEDDLKVTATLKDGTSITEEDLFRWSVEQLPYFALPRYIEFRQVLPRSALGRVLKRQLRDEGVTNATWDVEASDVVIEKR